MTHRAIAISFLSAVAIAATLLANPPTASACTRALYFGKSGQTTTGRTMDWQEDLLSNLWIFPREMTRNGAAGPNSLEWTSKFGSLVVSIYEGGTADGMNERGLVTNLLYLAEAEYPAATDPRPGIAITAWAQYILDNFATVEEAVAELRKESFRVVPVTAPNGAKGSIHLAISDPTGDSAILEYIGGKLVIHHGRQYQIMTNSPTYDEQLALVKYWQQIGGTTMLPGTNRAADRFARASFYINAANHSDNPREAVASVLSVMRNVSVPRGIAHATQPNISSTIWLTVADQKNLVYYYQNTFSPGLIWVDLTKLDFSPTSGTRKLQLDGNYDTAGNQTQNFKPAEPFKFLTPH